MTKFRYAVILALALSACAPSKSTPGASASGASSSPSATSSASQSPSPISSPTPPAIPAGPLPKSGAASASCQKGWVSPKPGSALFNFPLGVIRNSVPVKGKLVVVEMRYFVGPESPPSDHVEILVVQRWYVKLYAAHDLRFQGRFLVEKRVFGSGVSAIAAYDTQGYKSPDWTGFQWTSEDLTRRPYPGLPGLWPGLPYDFVNGTPPNGVRPHGLPDQAVGCLAGT